MLNRSFYGWLALAFTCFQLFVPSTSAALTVTASFSQRGISGTITFTQATPEGATTIDVSLTGLNNIVSNSFPWHVHVYPFPHDGVVNPCGNAIVGGHYDPLNAIADPNYDTICNMQTPQNCEIGDLSGKFGGFRNAAMVTERYTDPNLSLYGVYSIIGRSIVIHYENGSRLVCANIGYPDSLSTSPTTGLLYSPFRNDFTGSIFYRQHTSGSSAASVYTNLFRIMGAENSNGHNWHVHEDPVDVEAMDCAVAGPHYNPRNVDVSDEAGYPQRCNGTSPTAQMNCEIGDQSNKGAPFDVVNRVTKQFYSDTDLPLLGDADGYLINNRSTVIHEENLGAPRIACANITSYQPLEAVSRFDESGISGSIRFYQRSPYDQTQVFVNLNGLQAMAAGYHVHEYPVGPGVSPARCSDALAGGHWNPTGITESGTTSDQFEIGDLSGKFGSLAGENNLNREYTDPNIPLFGPFSIIGRSIVIHRDDAEGTRWICSDIQHISRVVQVTTSFNTGTLSGRVIFYQPYGDPYAETTIVVEIDVQQMIQLPANSDNMVEFDWSYRVQTAAETNCNALSTLDVFDSNPTLCSPTRQLACPAGDLSSKHGRLLIPQAAGGSLRAVYTDTNLPLSGLPTPNSVFVEDGIPTGRLYIWPVGGASSPSVCEQSTAPPTSGGTPSMAQVSPMVVVSICLVYMTSLLLNW